MGEKEKGHIRLLDLLQKVLDKVNAGYTIEEILAHTVNSIKDVFEAQSCAVLLVDPQAKKVKVKSSRGLSGEFIKQLISQEAKGILLDIFTCTGSILVTKNHPYYSQGGYRFQHPYDILLAAPIRDKGRVVGLIYIDTLGRVSISEEEIDTFNKLANLIGLILSYARLDDLVHQYMDFDLLTELHSFKYFHEALFREIQRAKHQSRPLSLCLMQVDQIKDINAIHGHIQGDQVLKVISHLIKSNIRGIDIPSRYTGSKFIIILPEADTPQATRIAEAIRKGVENHPFDLKGIQVTISAGVSTYPTNADNEKDLIKNTEVGLYTCRRLKGNVVVAGTTPTTA